MKRKKLTGWTVMVGKPEINADLLYETGFLAPDELVYACCGQSRFMVVSELEYSRAARLCNRIKVLTPEMIGLGRKESRSVSNWAIALINKKGIKKCRIPEWQATGFTRALEDAGIIIETGNTNTGLRRTCKTEAELCELRKAQHAAVAGMKTAMSLIHKADIAGNGRLTIGRKALTSEWVRTEIEKTLLEHQCNTPCGTIVACGKSSTDPHEPGTGPLYAEQPIVIDIFPRRRTSGYWGDLTRTFVRGTPSPALMKMYRSVKKAQREALKLVKPKTSCRTIHSRVCKIFDSDGFHTENRDGKPVGFIHSTGHGVGLDIHEEPRISRFDTRLRKGHVITVEPGLYYPELGGIRIEDTVEVTETGWKPLATMSYKWIL